MRLKFSLTGAQIAQDMEAGEIDLLIDSARVVPDGLNVLPLLEVPFIMAQRKGHPRGTAALDLNAYCALRHVVISPQCSSIRGYMDDYLELHGRERNTVLSVLQTMMVADILQCTDYVCTLPH